MSFEPEKFFVGLTDFFSILLPGALLTYLVEDKVLPKGHVEAGERMQETAVREVREETGVWARIKSPLGTVSFSVNAQRVEVQFYLMEALEEDNPVEPRRHVWLPLDEALGKASHEESRELLRSAATRIRRHGKEL